MNANIKLKEVFIIVKHMILNEHQDRHHCHLKGIFFKNFKKKKTKKECEICLFP
jgi:hypothetical protein